MKIAKWLAFCCCLLAACLSYAGECKPLNGIEQSSILANLSKRWNLGDPKTLKLEEGGFLGDTCYRRLALTGGPLKHSWSIFLSPDARFVMGSLVDTWRDPELDAAEEAQHNNALLLADPSASKGPAKASVTVVEFGDFQCPYCRQFEEWVKLLPADMRTDVKLVYKHLPLGQHTWARSAAKAAACAGMQSQDSFWLVHDFLFDQQPTLTAATIRERLSDFVAGKPSMDKKRFLACLDDGGSDSIIVRDEALAERLLVTHTPTVFINGRRLAALPSLEKLKENIVEALQLASPQARETKPAH